MTNPIKAPTQMSQENNKVMIKDLNDHYKVGQTVIYSGDKATGEIIKVTKRTIKIKYQGYTKTFCDIKSSDLLFLQHLKIL